MAQDIISPVILCKKLSFHESRVYTIRHTWDFQKPSLLSDPAIFSVSHGSIFSASQNLLLYVANNSVGSLFLSDVTASRVNRNSGLIIRRATRI